MRRDGDKQNVKINNIGMFDFSRGLLILFVVLGHCVLNFVDFEDMSMNMSIGMLLLVLVKLLSYGIMPMFFMMSGYGFRKQKIKKCLKDRFGYLIKPYLYVSVIVILIAILKKILLRRPVFDALKYQVIPLVLGLPSPCEMIIGKFGVESIGPLWFFLTLALAWFGLNLTYRITNEKVKVIVIIVVAILGVQLPERSFMPFCLAQSMCCMLYLYIGYYVKKNNMLVRKFPVAVYVILIPLLVIVGLFGHVDVSQNVWKLNMLDYMASCVAGFLLLRWSILSECINGRIANFIRLLGRNSLKILCVHTVDYLVFPWKTYEKIFAEYPIVGIIVAAIIRIVFIFCGCVLVNALAKRKRRVSK